MNQAAVKLAKMSHVENVYSAFKYKSIPDAIQTKILETDKGADKIFTYESTDKGDVFYGMLIYPELNPKEPEIRNHILNDWNFKIESIIEKKPILGGVVFKFIV